VRVYRNLDERYDRPDHGDHAVEQICPSWHGVPKKVSICYPHNSAVECNSKDKSGRNKPVHDTNGTFFERVARGGCERPSFGKSFPFRSHVFLTVDALIDVAVHDTTAAIAGFLDHGNVI
jgi:hypothetical protein